LTSGNYDQVNYSDEKMNPPLPDSAFELNAPAGVKRVNVK
jgi:outer membrane lipoprotein-sorting protein